MSYIFSFALAEETGEYSCDECLEEFKPGEEINEVHKNIWAHSVCGQPSQTQKALSHIWG